MQVLEFLWNIISQTLYCYYFFPRYDEQLEKKFEEVTTTIKRLGSEIIRANPGLVQRVTAGIAEHGTVAPIQKFLKSPVLRGYRNKVEFSVGYSNTEASPEETEKDEDMSLDTSSSTHESNMLRPAVGFRLATYKQGTGRSIQLKGTQVFMFP